jgi:hypothetical protein
MPQPTDRRAPFHNWKAMAAVIEFARQHPEVRPADFRLLMEVAACTDPDTGAARVSVRTLAAAVHHDDPAATWRRLRACEKRGWLERQGTGRQGRAELRNTETYRLTVAVTATVSGVVTVAAVATARVAATATVIDKKRRPLTEGQRLAMQAAKLDLRNGTHTPNGDGRAGTERSVPGHPPAVLGGKAAEDPASPNDEDDHGTTPGTPGEPWDQGNPSTNPGNLIPFKARPSDPGTPRGAARTQSGEVTRDSMGGAVLRPTADLEDDDAFWTAGEEAVWQLAQEIKAGAYDEPAELFESADHRDPRRFMR